MTPKIKQARKETNRQVRNLQDSFFAEAFELHRRCIMRDLRSERALVDERIAKLEAVAREATSWIICEDLHGPLTCLVREVAPCRTCKIRTEIDAKLEET